MFQFIFQTIRLQFFARCANFNPAVVFTARSAAAFKWHQSNQILIVLKQFDFSHSLSLSLSSHPSLSSRTFLFLSISLSLSLSYVYVSFFLCFSPGSPPLSILFFYYVLFSNLCHVVLRLVAKWPSCSNSHISKQQFKANLVKKFYFQTCKRTPGLTSQTKPVLHCSTFQLIYLLAPPALNLECLRRYLF